MLGLQAKKLIKYRAESSRYSSLDLDFKKTCDSTFSGSMLWLTALSESLSFCRTFSLKCNDLHKHSTASSIRGNGKKRKVFKEMFSALFDFFFHFVGAVVIITPNL